MTLWHSTWYCTVYVSRNTRANVWEHRVAMESLFPSSKLLILTSHPSFMTCDLRCVSANREHGDNGIEIGTDVCRIREEM